MPLNPILEMKNVTKRFGGTIALNDVSIELFDSEILAICGENGAGKSTLMKVLSGSYDYSSYSGSILVDGKPCRFKTPADASAAGIEMIYQEISVHLDLSVAENIFINRMPASNGLVRWQSLFSEAQKYIDMVGLDVPVTTILRDLSASQCQMVSIARALSRNPRILVLDEPTSPLTDLETENLFTILDRLRLSGISCIYISHRLREIKRIADRVCIMRDGCKVWAKDANGLSIDEIVEAMVNRKIDKLFPSRTAPITETVLSVHNLKVKHPYNRKKYIVNGIDFSVRKGEILGLVGLVGSGRSEIVNALFGANDGTYDALALSGKTISIKNPQEAVNNGMALLTEDRKVSGFIPTLDITKNISLPRLDKVSAQSIIKRLTEKRIAKEYIHALKIKAQSENDMVTQLSGGNQQKVVLSKWLMASPKVLLLDEPTRGIDVGAKQQIYQIMTELAHDGMAIVMISSEFSELIGMCDRFLLLNDGIIVKEMYPEEANEEAFLRICSGGSNEPFTPYVDAFGMHIK